MATQAEFKLWLADFGTYFPDLASYASKLPDSKATVERGWYRTLAPYSLVVLGTVTDRILDGKLDHLEPSDYGLFAHRIRAYAARIADDIAKAKGRQKHKDEAEEQKFSGVAREAMVNSRDLFVHSRAAIRVCRLLNFDAKWEDEVNLAVVTLHDNPTEAERARSLQVIHSYGLTPEQLTPIAEDYGSALLQSVPPEEEHDANEVVEYYQPQEVARA